MKGGEKLQLELTNSLKKIESTSGAQGKVRGKVDGKFLSLINDLKTTYQHSSPAQTNTNYKEDINQLLAILSSSSEDGNLQQKMDTETMVTGIDADQIQINLEYLLANYQQFSQGEGIVDIDESNMAAKLAELFVNLENKIAHELKIAINMKLEPDMFKDTELSTLLTDLKLLERTVKELPDKSIEEKVTESIEYLQGFMISLKQFLEQDGSNMMKNDSQKMEKLWGEREKYRFPAVDTKQTAMQNFASQENKNILFREANTIEINSELKSIISSILSKIDMQTNEKKTVAVQKVINPVMVSFLRKSEENTLSSTEVKKTAQVSHGDTDSKVISTIQNNIFKQHPLTLLTDSGELAAPKNVEDQFAKLLAKSTFIKTGDIQKLSMRLAPDHLGSIRIEITQNEGNMIARIITANTEAKDVLDKQLTSLKHGLSAQNLQVDKIDIVVSSQPQERLQREQQQQQEQQQSHPQRDKKDADDEEDKQKASFFEELLNFEV